VRFHRWVFCTAGSDITTKMCENEHWNSWDNTGLSPSELAFSFVAMSHLDGLEKQPVLVTYDCILLLQIKSSGLCISIRIYQVAKLILQVLLVSKISDAELFWGTRFYHPVLLLLIPILLVLSALPCLAAGLWIHKPPHLSRWQEAPQIPVTLLRQEQRQCRLWKAVWSADWRTPVSP